jgi:RND superfamily putative drug exporter
VRDGTASNTAPRGFLARWGRISYRHRGKIIIAWVVALAALFGAYRAFGGTFVSEFKVPGSEVETAQDLLNERFPARAGDNADLVFEAPAGVRDPAVQPRIQAVLDRVAQLDGVVSVESPYDQPRFISGDGTIARAVVHWSEKATKISAGKVDRFLAVVDAAGGEGLRVEAGGRVVQATERPEFGSEVLGLLAAVFILLVAFGSVVAMGLPLLAAIFGLGVGFAIIGLAANAITFPAFSPQFAAMIGIGVGIDYSLLIVTRFREGIHTGHTVEESVVRAVTTAGRSVVFAGMVVAVAFLGLYVVGLPFVAALGTAGAIVVAAAVLVALTLIPAAMAMAGHRIDSLRLPVLHATEGVDPRSVWYRLSEAIQRHPLPYFLGAAALLLFLASPTLSMRLGFTDAHNNPESMHTRRAYDLLTKGFGPGFNGQLFLVADLSNGGGDAIERLRARVEDTDGVAQVSPAVLNPAGDTALVTVIPATAPQDEATTRLVHRLRDDVVPAATAGSGAKVYVAGGLAGFIDAQDRIGQRMPLLFTGVIGLSFVLLTIVFRSLVVAAKAAVMNLLSIGASYGVLVVIFQWGWFSGIVGIEKGPIETFLPMMMFAILFGLSMDYEVFLISRVREEYVRTGDNAAAVSHGLAATARVITAAAAIMVAVFITFVFGPERTIKEFGVGLATAIFVDATIVRLILVPSTMELLGDLNWWLPRWLDRLMPRVSVEAPPETREPEAAVAAGGGGS